MKKFLFFIFLVLLLSSSFSVSLVNGSLNGKKIKVNSPKTSTSTLAPINVCNDLSKFKYDEKTNRIILLYSPTELPPRHSPSDVEAGLSLYFPLKGNPYKKDDIAEAKRDAIDANVAKPIILILILVLWSLYFLFSLE